MPAGQFRLHGVTHKGKYAGPVTPIILIGGQCIVDSVSLCHIGSGVRYAADAQDVPYLRPRQASIGIAQCGADRFDFLLFKDLLFHDDPVP